MNNLRDRVRYIKKRRPFGGSVEMERKQLAVLMAIELHIFKVDPTMTKTARGRKRRAIALQRRWCVVIVSLRLMSVLTFP